MKPKYQGAFLIARIHQTAGRVFETILKEYGLDDISPAQGRILFALWKNDNIPIQDLARETSLSKSTLTVMLDRLENQRLINRVPSTKDRREILIRLTEKDRSLQDSYVRVSEEMAGIFLAGFSEQEVLDFEDKLSRVLVNLTGHEQKIKKTAR